MDAYDAVNWIMIGFGYKLQIQGKSRGKSNIWRWNLMIISFKDSIEYSLELCKQSNLFIPGNVFAVIICAVAKVLFLVLMC